MIHNNLHWPNLDQDTLCNIQRVIDSGRLSLKNLYLNAELNEGNSLIRKFEKEFAEHLGVKYGLLTNNGTVALTVALLAADVKENDYVIVPNCTWVSSASCALLINAIPVIVDINQDTLNLDPKNIRQAILKYKRKIKALVLVHLNGIMGEMDEILALCDQYQIKVIEDCAQAIGSEYKGRKAGTFGSIGAFSFQEYKVLTAGEGGFVCTNSEEYYKKLRMYIDLTEVQKTNMIRNRLYLFGSNFRYTEIQAAILVDQFQKYQKTFHLKEQRILEMIRQLNTIEDIETIKYSVSQTAFSFYRLPFFYHGSKEKYQKLFAALKKQGVPIESAQTLYYRTPLFSPKPDILYRMKYDKLTFTELEEKLSKCIYVHHSWFEESNHDYGCLYDYIKNEVANI